MNKGALAGIFIVILIASFAVVWFASNNGGGSEISPIPSVSASAAPSLVKATITPQGDMVVLNATEYSAVEGPVQVIEEAGCAGGKCIFIEDNVLGKPVQYLAKITYRFNAPKAGTYKVWVRHWWKDECGNSLLLSFNGETPKLLGDDGTVNYWRWPPAMKLTVELQQGENTLEIIPREDGLKFDQILITTDMDFYPVGIIDNGAVAPKPAPEK